MTKVKDLMKKKWSKVKDGKAAEYSDRKGGDKVAGTIMDKLSKKKR